MATGIYLDRNVEDTHIIIPQEGQVLGFHNGKWENVNPTGGALVIDDLTDVEFLTPPTEGQMLVYHSGRWTALTVTGTGDMLKAEYDTDNDGRVDSANDALSLNGYSPEDFALAVHPHILTELDTGTLAPANSILSSDGMRHPVWVEKAHAAELADDAAALNGHSDADFSLADHFHEGTEIHSSGGNDGDVLAADGAGGTIWRPRSSKFYGARVVRMTAQVIPASTLTPLSFSTTMEDSGGAWSSQNPTRLVAPISGWYMAGGSIFMASTQNVRAGRLNLRVNLISGGETYIMGLNEVHTIAGKNVALGLSTGLIYMAEGEYIEVVVYHDQAGDASITGASNAYGQGNFNAWLQCMSAG